ncbi:hypothetical protein B0O80DRAFT_467054 [Mortierella sp. GBAus27b]|nr:hypothetical protein B0O80DRAFT_467040 [Mortierella sp. GBAus27b]KAI8346727.1 hypothetical protein B0O80DRAFT_467054 [Mortierella sp. GBAus27b]
MTNTALITRATRGRGSRAASSQEGVVQVHTPRRHVTPGDGDMDAGAQDRDSDTSTSKDSDGIDSGSEPSDDVIDSDVIDGDVTDGDDSDSDVDNSDSVDANAAGDINPMANAEPTSGNSEELPPGPSDSGDQSGDDTETDEELPTRIQKSRAGQIQSEIKSRMMTGLRKHLISIQRDNIMDVITEAYRKDPFINTAFRKLNGPEAEMPFKFVQNHIEHSKNKKVKCPSSFYSVSQLLSAADGRKVQFRRVNYSFRHNHALQDTKNLREMRKSKLLRSKIQALIERAKEIHEIQDELSTWRKQFISREGAQHLRRDDFVTYDDVYHIYQKIIASKFQKHKDEFPSCQLWMNTLQSEGYFIYNRHDGLCYGFSSQWQMEQ